MATVTSSKRHLQLTSDTYESNGIVTIGGDNLYFDGSNTYLRSDNQFRFLTDGGSAQVGKFKSIQVSTSYSGTPLDNGILFHTDTNLYRSAANTLKTDDSLIILGHTTMVTGHTSGKFAVKSTGVHASYDFYNNGTSYFNGGVIIDDNLSFTGDDRILNLAGGTTNSEPKLIIGEQGTYGVSFRWNTGAELEFDGFWNSSVTGARNRDLGSIDVNNRIWYLNNNVTVGNDLTATGDVITNSYFQVNSSSALLKKYVSGWNSGVQTHDILYNGWLTNTGDYTYLKSAGNSTSGHGIIVAADNGTYLGTTDIETGGITDSATAPLTNTWAYFRNASAYVKGDATFDGSITVGDRTVTTSTTNYEKVLRIKGKNNYSDGTTWYGTYGQILLHSDSNMTSSARRFLITNAYENNKFAIVRSTDANTDPVVNSTGTGANSGTPDFIINNSGNVTLSGDLTVNGGNIAVNNNNGGIQFNDANSYWLRTATNWGIYWNTSNNQIQFHGTGNTRAFIDLDSGRIQGNEHGIFASNVYAGGAQGFVFGSSTSEGEYIQRSGDDIAFVAGGAERARIDTDVNSSGDPGFAIASGGRLGFDQSGTRSWTVKAASGQLQFNSGDGGGSFYFGSSIVLNNKAISGVDSFAFNDPGPNEGISWSGGNFKIYESPDDLTTNTAGNLQFVSGSTRVVSIGKAGEPALQVIGSGSTVLDIQGSQGQLFSITDDLTGDLFSVSDISGVPILNVNASGDSYFDGNLDISGSLNVTGSAFFNGSMGNSPAANPGVHIGISTGNDGQIQIIGTSAHIDFANAGSEDYDARIILEGNDELNVAGVGNNFQVNGNRVLTTADEGSGNGIDADTLDGNHASAFLTSYTETDTLATVTGRGATTSTTCTFDTVTINTPIVGSAAKIRFQNNDYLRFDDTANRFHFDVDGGTSNASVQAATFVGALSGNATSATNADTVDNLHAGDFLRSNADDTVNSYTSNIRFPSNTAIESTGGSNASLEVYQGSAGHDAFMTFHVAGDYAVYFGLDGASNDLAVGGWSRGAVKQRIFHDGYHPNADQWTTGRTLTIGNTGKTVTGGGNVDWTLSEIGATPLDHIRSLGTTAFTGTATTAGLISEMEGDGAFDSYSSVFKTSWSYAGNFNLSDAGRFTETAGTSFLTWTDNSSDSTRGNITVLAIAPNTGGSAGKMFVYNDQGSGYAPGWREIWTSTSDGAGSGLDADLLDGQHGSHYLNWNNFTNKPSTFSPSSHTHAAGDITSGTFSDRFSVSTRYSIGLTDGSTAQTRDKIRVWSGGTYTIGMKSGMSYGHLNDYAMTFQMNSDNDRGWWWGDSSHTDAQGAMSLTTNGRLTVATSLSIGQGESKTNPSTNTLYVAGTIQATADVVAYQSSDERLKDNVTPIDNAVDKVKQLGGYEFDWNDKQDTYEGHDVGVLAQEVEKVLPEVVEEREDGYKAVKYEKIVPLLIEGIKEQQKQIDELKAIVNKLQNEK